MSIDSMDEAEAILEDAALLAGLAAPGEPGQEDAAPPGDAGARAALLDELHGAGAVPPDVMAAAIEETEPGVYPNFNNPDGFANRDAPAPAVTFAIGGVLMLVTALMWWRRMQKLRRRRGGDLAGKQWVQGALACALDNDEPLYTIVSYAASSFLFLGGLQMDFQKVWLGIVCIYFTTSMGDTVRTLLAASDYDSLADRALLQDMDHGGAAQKGRVKGKEEESADFHKIEINPGNIYEDIGRGPSIVSMVFVMQVLMIVLVCVDMYNSNPDCLDGTKGCPVGRTLGSYLMYIIGIFLACVYMLGPKTDFGHSEQNPEFWLVLLLAMKGEGYKILWANPMECPIHSAKGYSLLTDENDNVIMGEDGEPKQYHCHQLTRNDFLVWRRFIESYIVNGVGYHILVHALPAQVSMQSSIMGIVFRAVGMMYLVDLDDSRGMTLTITRDAMRPVDQKEEPPSAAGGMPDRRGERAVEKPGPGEPGPGEPDPDALCAQIKEVLDRAHAEIDRLNTFGPEEKAPEEKEKARRMSRQISSQSVLLNIIGYGVTGLGGSGPRGREGAAKAESEVEALTTELNVLKKEMASLRSSAVTIRAGAADGDLEREGAGETQLVRLRGSAPAYPPPPPSDISLDNSFLEALAAPSPPGIDPEAPSPAAAGPGKQFDKQEELVVVDDLRGRHDHVKLKVLNGDIKGDIERDDTASSTLSSLAAPGGEVDRANRAKRMGMTVDGMANEWVCEVAQVEEE